MARITNYQDFQRDWGTVTSPSAEFEAWLERNAIPQHIVEQFRLGVLQDHQVDLREVEFGPHEWVVMDERSIMSENPSADKQPLRDGLLLIGSGPDGTQLAIDLLNNVGAVGYINHERYWHSPDLQAEYIEVANSLDEFARMAYLAQLPCDYCDAIERLNDGKFPRL